MLPKKALRALTNHPFFKPPHVVTLLSEAFLQGILRIPQIVYCTDGFVGDVWKSNPNHVRVVRDAVLQALLITFSTETSRPQSSKTTPNERYLMDSIMSDPEKLMTTNKK